MNPINDWSFICGRVNGCTNLRKLQTAILLVESEKYAGSAYTDVW